MKEADRDGLQAGVERPDPRTRTFDDWTADQVRHAVIRFLAHNGVGRNRTIGILGWSKGRFLRLAEVPLPGEDRADRLGEPRR